MVESHIRAGAGNFPGGQPRTWVGDVPVAVTDVGAAARFLMKRADGGTSAGRAVRLIGAKEVALASKSEAYRALLSGPGTNFPDGLPVVWATRLQPECRGGEARRVRGATLFRTTLDQGRGIGLRHFFLGTTPETLRKLVDATEVAYPGVQVVGSWAPPFEPLDDEFFRRGAEEAQRVRADLVWVGLGAPKQDEAVAGLATRSSATFVAVGAAFDFLAGTAAEAPLWMQDHGLEWLFRLASDPRRLWRRYLIGNAEFLAVLATHQFRRGTLAAKSRLKPGTDK